MRSTAPWKACTRAGTIDKATLRSFRRQLAVPQEFTPDEIKALRETGILVDVHSDPPVSAEAW
ncbi:hypothetical protein NKI61_32350 [Mesorhizobium sp. M0514]|uniref:hypothetical protein n=1 Tax=Mesorhizobium sp. M0514 TaxID=2956955 RepID=UPI00333B606E